MAVSRECRLEVELPSLALVKTELKRALLLANVAATSESPFYGQAEKDRRADSGPAADNF